MSETISRKDRNIVALIFLASLVVFIAGTGGHLYSGDEEINYVLAESMYHFHQFSLSNETRYVRAFDINVTQFCTYSGSHGGRCYSKWGIMEPVLAIPFIALAESLSVSPWRFLEILFYPIITAATCALIYLVGLKLRYSRKASVLLSFVYGFSSFALPYSKFFNDGPLQVLFLASAALFLIGNEQSLVKAGSLVGLAVLTRVSSVLFVPLIIVYIFRRNRCSVVGVLRFLLPLCLAFAVLAAYNFVRFGSFSDFGQGYSQTLAAYSALSEGVPGLMMSPGVGIVYYFPLVLLVPYGAYRLFSNRRSDVLLFVSFFVVTLIFYGSYLYWNGWGYWGPRFLMGALPFLVLMLGPVATEITENSARRVLRSIFCVLLVAGIFVNLLGELVWFQLGFALVWGKFGSAWVPVALWQPEYSPIWEHFKVAFGFVGDSRINNLYPTSFGYGNIAYQRYDPLVINAFGPVIALCVVAVPLALLLYLLHRALRQGNIQTAT